MSGWFQSMGNAWEQYIWQPILDFNFWDALDILLLTAFLYGVYVFLKGRRAGTLAVGLILILAFYVISDLAGLRAIHELMRGIVAPSAIIILAIVFQPELRDALEKLGSTPRGLFSTAKGNRADLAHTVGEVVDAAFQIAQSEKDGALIVIERSTPLGDYAAKGHLVDAHVSAGLLRNIFVDRSPLHDGAVIIRNNRIAAAGSKLPLSSNEGVVRGMGTRHRAAVGITEVSDCVVVVVSEERHTISVASNGFIKRDYIRRADDLQDENRVRTTQNELRNDLFLLLVGTEYGETAGARKRRSLKPNIRFRWRLGDKNDSAEESKSKPAKAGKPAAPAEPDGIDTNSDTDTTAS